MSTSVLTPPAKRGGKLEKSLYSVRDEITTLERELENIAREKKAKLAR